MSPRNPRLALGAVLLALASPAAAQVEPAPAPEISSAAASVVAGAPEPDAEVAPDPDPAEGESEITGLQLAELLRRAETHPLMGAARAQLEIYRAKLLQAQLAPWSNWNLSVRFAVTPPIEGGVLDNDEGGIYDHDLDPAWDSSLSDWGPWVSLELSGAIPLYTFGKLSAAQAAAEAGVQAGEEGIEGASQRVRWEVRRAYFSLQLAREILYLIDDGRGYIDDAREEVQERLARGDPGASTMDLYRLDAAVAEVDARAAQARRLEAVSREGLRLLAGLAPEETVADLPLEPLTPDRGTLEEYQDRALGRRPELRMLGAGIAAQRAKRHLEWAGYFPDLLLLVGASYSYAPHIYNQHNPWVSDPYNGSGVGGSLYLRYPFDFVMDHARVEEADATLDQLEAQREALGQAVQAEVADAYGAVEEAAARMEAYDRGRRAAKRWLIAVLQGMTLGLQDANDMTDALVSFFQGELNYLTAVYDYDVAWSRLEQATGDDLLDAATDLP